MCAVCLHNRDHFTVYILFCNLLFLVNNISGTPFRLSPYRCAIYLSLSNFLLFILFGDRKHIYMIQKPKQCNRHIVSFPFLPNFYCTCFLLRPSMVMPLKMTVYPLLDQSLLHLCPTHMTSQYA